MGYAQQTSMNPEDYLNRIKTAQQSSLKSQPAPAAPSTDTDTISSIVVNAQKPDDRDRLVAAWAFVGFANKVGNLVFEMSIKLRDAYDEILELRRRNGELEATQGENENLTCPNCRRTLPT